MCGTFRLNWWFANDLLKLFSWSSLVRWLSGSWSSMAFCRDHRHKLFVLCLLLAEDELLHLLSAHGAKRVPTWEANELSHRAKGSLHRAVRGTGQKPALRYHVRFLPTKHEYKQGTHTQPTKGWCFS